MRRLALAAVGALALTLPAHAERLTIAVSTPNVTISSNFVGAPVTVFGVIDQTPPNATPDLYRVAILVVGQDEKVVARRKDRVLGVWVNDAAETIGSAPSFYALSSTGAPDALASPAVLQRLEIGFDNIGFTFDGGAASAGGSEFRDAYLRLKQQAGLYAQATNVSFLSGNLIFRASAYLPANIAVGRYQVLAYLFSGGDLIANTHDTIDVAKSGPEGTVSAFAHGQSLIYGLLCAGLALFVGWAGGVIFRRD